jgi:Uma2 family endonuclease
MTRRGQSSWIGPDDHGRLMTLEECNQAREEPGYVYELIDGVLIVSPNPNPIHDHWVVLIRRALEEYAGRNPGQINNVSEHSDVVIAGRPGVTRPQPDIAAFRDFPDPPPAGWEDVCPLIVVEIISQRREKKDTVRNRQLYWMAGGVMEYWIVDPREDEQRPTLTALVRRPGGPDWSEQVVAFGKTYRCKTLPRFSLNLRRPKRK